MYIIHFDKYWTFLLLYIDNNGCLNEVALSRHMQKPSCANKDAICSHEIEFRINSTEPCFLKSNYDRKNPVIATPLNFLTLSEWYDYSNLSSKTFPIYFITLLYLHVDVHVHVDVLKENLKVPKLQ